jgi:ubiquinone/menaquinone biosynthesis C-methylase UbiE
MSTYAEALYRDRLFSLVGPETEWIDLGCGRQLLPGWLKNSNSDQTYLSSRCKRLVGVDSVAEDVLQHPYLHERVVGDFLSLPFEDGSFNLLTARSVVEHVENPSELLREIYRVLKPGGHFVFATPNYLYYQTLLASLTPRSLKQKLVQALEERSEQDIFPVHYVMNTPSTITRLVKDAGLKIESLDTVECPPEFIRLGGPILNLERAITALLRSSWLSPFRAVIVATIRKPTNALN